MAKRRSAVRRRSSRLLLALTAVGVLVGGAAAGAVLLRSEGPEAAGAGVPDPTVPPTEAPTSEAPTPTTEPSTTTAPPTTAPPTTAPPTTAPPDPSLRPGTEGPEVLALQQRLTDLGFWLGEPDGSYAHLTQQAVMAFQKANDLGRDGIAGPQTLAALETATRPVPSVVSDGIEISIDRQLLLVVQGGQTVFALNTSTGRSGWRTPRGDFTITREIDGLRVSELGELWRPKYFNGGIAIHGSPSIPAQPASHGCTRVSNGAIDMLWQSGLAEVGTLVVVY